MEINEKVHKIMTILEEKKAEDIVALDVETLTTVADRFIICSGLSTPHVRALADDLDDRMAELGEPSIRKEGYETAKWILMDFSDVVVHIFAEETRKFYSLEWLWSDAKNLQPDKGEDE